MTGITAILLRMPVLVVRGDVPCQVLGPRAVPCGWPEHSGVHEPVAECLGKDGAACHAPLEHHPYQPTPWWRAIRREKPWERA